MKNFDVWMKAVNQQLILICGMSSDDLADCPYSDWWEDGMSVKGAARKAIKFNS